MGTVEPCTSFDGAYFCQVCFFIMSVSWFVQLVSLFVVLSDEYDGGDIKDFIPPLVKFYTASIFRLFICLFSSCLLHGLFKSFLVYCPVCALNKYIPSYNFDTLNSVLAQMC